MASGRLSAEEIDCLRRLIGERIVAVCSPVLLVYEKAILATSPSLRLEEGKGFVVLEAADIETSLSKDGLYLFSRPSFAVSHTPAVVPYDSVREIVGPCSFVKFKNRFVIERVEIFEGESTVHHGDVKKTETITHDKQVTFHAEAGDLLSVTAEGDDLWFFRDMGHPTDSSAGLQRRLLLQRQTS